MKVVEIFPSIQGEVEGMGEPMVFVRLAGCNRRCPYCDTKYSWEGGKEMSVKKVFDTVMTKIWRYWMEFEIKPKSYGVCITGGEPLLQKEEVIKLIKMLRKRPIGRGNIYLETNGDLLDYETTKFLIDNYVHINISPKTEEIAKKTLKIIKKISTEYMNKLFKTRFPSKQQIAEQLFKAKSLVTFKIVTDLEKIGTDIIEYADALMPLTTGDREKDIETAQKVWDYCVKNGLRFSGRLQYWVWGNKKRK